MRLAGLLLIVALLSGCETIRVFTFQKAPNSGKGAQKASLYLIQSSPAPGGTVIDSLVKQDDALAKAVDQHCVDKPPPSKTLALPLVPIIAAAGQLAFDLIADWGQRRIEALKKSSEASYSGKLLVPAVEFNNSRCLLITRFTGGKENEKGLTALLLLRRQPDRSFVMEPMLVRARNSVAVTARDTPTVAVTFALSIKGVVKSKEGLPTLTALGEGIATIPKVSIASDGKAYECSKDCIRSDLIPAPVSNPISIALSVVETGDVGADIDVAAAQLKAMKEALGPAISKGVEIWVTPKEE